MDERLLQWYLANVCKRRAHRHPVALRDVVACALTYVAEQESQRRAS